MSGLLSKMDQPWLTFRVVGFMDYVKQLQAMPSENKGRQLELWSWVVYSYVTRN